EVGIMHAALGENIGQRMPHQLADAQLPLRAAGRGFFLVVARHYRRLKIAMTRALAGDSHLLFNRDRGRMAGTRPAIAPLADFVKIQSLWKIPTYSERWIVSTR